MNGPGLPRLNSDDAHDDVTRDGVVVDASEADNAEDVTDFASDASEEATRLQAPDPKILAGLRPPIPREEK